MKIRNFQFLSFDSDCLRLCIVMGYYVTLSNLSSAFSLILKYSFCVVLISKNLRFPGPWSRKPKLNCLANYSRNFSARSSTPEIFRSSTILAITNINSPPSLLNNI